MHHRFAAETDLHLLAQMNHALIRDEGARNRMTVPELQQRMAGWLRGEYRAILFEHEEAVAGYALYRPSDDGVYLRQLYIVPEQRRRGLGRQAVSILREQIWPRQIRVTVDVLNHNHSACAFWRAVGFVPWSTTLEMFL